MKRITTGGDINFNVSSIHGLGEEYTIKFYTTDKSNFILRVDGDVDNDTIRLEWSDLESLGGGVLNYIAENITANQNYNDGAFNRTFGGTTNYYIVTSINGDGSQAEIAELDDKLDQEIERSTAKDNEHDAAIVLLQSSTYSKNEVYTKQEVNDLINSIETGEINIGIVDNLNSSEQNKALSAKQGNVLKVAIEQLREALANMAFKGNKPVFSWETTPTVTHNVSWELDGLTLVGDSTVEDGQTWTGTISANSGYILPETLTSVTGDYDTVTYLNGTITITNIASDIVITASGVEEIIPTVRHNISWTLNNLSIVGNSTIVDGETWVGRITADSGYTLPETLTNVSGTYGNVNYNNESGDITITNVTSDITITASGVQEIIPVVYHNVSWNLTNLTLVGNSTVEDGQTWTGTLVANSGYTLPETLTSVVGTYGNMTYLNGTITITNITSDITITASGVEEIVAVTHNITKRLLNYTSNDATDTIDTDFGYLTNTIEDGETYITYITPLNGVQPNNDVKIKMGNTVITDEQGVYDSATGKIEIPNVTDDIVITATAATGVIKVTANVEDGAECSITINGATYPLINGVNTIPDNITNITSISLYNTTYASKYTAFDFGGAVMQNQNLASKFRLANLTSVKGLVIKNPTSMQYIFYGDRNLTEIQTIGWATQNCSIVAGAFTNCRGLTKIDLEDFVGSSTSGITILFDTCLALTKIRGLNTWNVQNVTDMSSMFNGCDVLDTIDISGWETTSKLTKMYNTFSNLKTIIIGNLNTSAVTSTQYISSTVNTIECTTSTPPVANTSDCWLKHIYPLYHNDAIITTGKIIVPSGSRDNYINADGWSEFADIIIEKQ